MVKNCDTPFGHLRRGEGTKGLKEEGTKMSRAIHAETMPHNSRWGKRNARGCRALLESGGNARVLAELAWEGENGGERGGESVRRFGVMSQWRCPQPSGQPSE
jgi:hypothetical protein